MSYTGDEGGDDILCHTQEMKEEMTSYVIHTMETKEEMTCHTQEMKEEMTSYVIHTMETKEEMTSYVIHRR